MSTATSSAEPGLPAKIRPEFQVGEEPPRVSFKWWWRRGRGFGAPWRVIFNAVIIFLAAQFIAGVVIALVSVDHGHTALRSMFNGSVKASFVYTGLAEGLAVVLVLWQLRRRFLTPKAIGLIKPRWRDLKRGLLGFGAFYGLLIIVSVLLNFVAPGINPNQPQDLGFSSVNGPLDSLLAFLTLVIFPPLGEEVLVRGYLFSGLRSRLSFVKAGLITSALFGFAHLQLGGGAPPLWAAGIDTFILSLVLVYLRERTGALYAGMLVHMLNNLVAFGVHFHHL